MDGEVREPNDGTELDARVASLDFLNATEIGEDAEAGDGESREVTVG